MEEERDRPWNFHTCRLCCYRSKSTFLMIRHIRWHSRRSATNTFVCNSSTLEMCECEICEFETDLKVALNEHRRLNHEGKNPNDLLETIFECYKCKNCNFQTHSVFVLTRHVNCNCVFTINSTDNRETKSENVKPVDSYSDQWYEFQSEGRRQWKYYKCMFCSFRTAHFINIKNHVMKSKHVDSNIGLFKCEQCDYKCKAKMALKLHFVKKHGKLEEWFKCDHCSYKSPENYKLKKHILSKHGRKHPEPSPKRKNWFQCGHCSYKSKDEGELTKHFLIHSLLEAEIMNLKMPSRNRHVI